MYGRVGEPQGPFWTGAENLGPTGIRSPDHPVSSESLYRLRCPGPAHTRVHPENRDMNPYLRESLESQIRGEDLIFSRILYWRLTHILKSAVGPLILMYLWQEEMELRTAADKCPLQKNVVASEYFTLQFMNWPRPRNDLHF